MKAREVLKGAAIAAGVIFTLGLASSLLNLGELFPEPTPQEEKHTITYIRADTGEDVLTTYSFMLKKQGNYPTDYTSETETFTISDLLGDMRPDYDNLAENELPRIGWEVSDPSDRKKSYGFYGWYLDEGCTVPFDGVVKRGSVSDLVIYAEIKTSTWTDFY